MRVTINGKDEVLDAGATVAGMLEAREAEPRRVAVEVNHELVSRREFQNRVLAEGDTIEIVTFVGGG